METSQSADKRDLWITWEDKYNLGIPVIDEQHRKLVDLCNELYEGLKQHRANEGEGWQTVLSNTLREAVQYTKFHFDAEEKILMAAGYKNLAHHKQCHVEFVDALTKVLFSFQKATLQTAFEFSAYLKEWVLTHIAYEDRLYVQCVFDYYQRMQSASDS